LLVIIKKSATQNMILDLTRKNKLRQISIKEKSAFSCKFADMKQTRQEAGFSHVHTG
jgi:TolB-like protein